MRKVKSSPPAPSHEDDEKKVSLNDDQVNNERESNDASVHITSNSKDKHRDNDWM